MKKIAVIFEGNNRHRYGVCNAVINRVKHLRAICPYQIDVFMIQVYDNWLMRQLRHTDKLDRNDTEFEMDGERIRILWAERSMVDSVMHHFCHKEPSHLLHRLRRMANLLSGYDLVTAHDTFAAHLARCASQNFHIPFFVTWHGSSIHTAPVADKMIRRFTLSLINQADCNFFVCNSLAEYAKQLFATGIKYRVLPNGANEQFVRYSNARRAELRASYGVTNKKVVTFAGRMEEVKNVTALPCIFKRIAQSATADVKFWLFGEGKLLKPLKQQMIDEGVDCTFWGEKPPEEMPDFLNCTDVLVLPSLQEASPLAAIEALSCGVNVVGSHVMGIPEIIGSSNVVNVHDALFVEKLSTRAAEMLTHNVEQPLAPDFSWSSTAKKELEIYNQFLS